MSLRCILCGGLRVCPSPGRGPRRVCLQGLPGATWRTGSGPHCGTISPRNGVRGRDLPAGCRAGVTGAVRSPVASKIAPPRLRRHVSTDLYRAPRFPPVKHFSNADVATPEMRPLQSPRWQIDRTGRHSHRRHWPWGGDLSEAGRHHPPRTTALVRTIGNGPAGRDLSAPGYGDQARRACRHPCN